jgi:hypothetical protein
MEGEETAEYRVRQCGEPVLRIRDVYPGSRILIFYPSRIPDPKTATKERSEKN